jgi:hypothetical protein
MSEPGLMASGAVRRRDAAVFSGIIVASLALVGVLWLLARDADSAGVSGSITRVELPEYSASEVCTNWATYWITDSGVNAPPEALEVMSNCRQTVDGGWIVPGNAADDRQLRPVILSEEQADEVSNLEAAILSQIGRFNSSMSNDLDERLERIYEPGMMGVTAHIRDGVPIGAARRLYEEQMNAFLERPGNQELAAYIAWAIPYRQAAFAQFLQSCTGDGLYYLRLTCDGTGDWLSVNHIPWTWDLSGSLLLDTYLLGVANGEIDPPPGYEITGPVTDESETT